MRVLALLPSLLLAASTALAQTCSNFGTALDSSCVCPAGLTSASSCVAPVCGGSLGKPGSSAAPLTSGGQGNTSTCACDDGWAGPTCTVCRSAGACANSLGSTSSGSSSGGLNTSLVCNTGATTYASSQLSCNVKAVTLQSLFPLQSVLTIQRTLDPAQSPKENVTSFGEKGTIAAQLWYDGVEQFYCKADSCVQTISNGSSAGNSSMWKCQDLKCSCINGTTFCSGITSIAGTINILSGELDIDCKPPASGASAGTCLFSQSILNSLFPPSGLELQDCSFGECVQQYVIDQALGIVGAGDAGGGSLSGGVIAGLAVVGAVLLFALALVGWGVLRRRKAKAVPYVAGSDIAGQSKGAGLAWTNVGYQVGGTSAGLAAFSGNAGAWMKGTSMRKGGSEGKVVLDGISGRLPVGGFCCVLGPSGAGKSTLVDILAGRRKAAGVTTGSVSFFTSDRNVGARHRIAFVDQSDVLSPTSTVRETLTFAADLRLAENVPAEVKRDRVFQVLTQLGLMDVADTRIGDGERRGISGGEARRVSIGIELIAAPEILILDEPTSGLDSVSAAKVISVLRDLSRDPDRPTTVIASIHQPSSRLYQTFDTVLLLANGRQLYFGPGGNAPARYFAPHGLVCPEGYNVADHLLEIASAPPSHLLTGKISPDVRSSDSDSDRIAPLSGSSSENLQQREKGKISDRHEMHELPVITKTGDDAYPEGNLETASTTTKRCATTFLTQLMVLSGREWRTLKRDKTLLLAHVVFACVLGVFAGGLYFKVDLTIAGFQNRVGSLFFLGSLLAFSTLSALYNLVEVRALFLRERAGSYYTPTAWLLARLLFDVIPLRVLPTILVSTIVYFMVGLSHDAARFFKFLLILLEFALGLTLFNFLLACVVRNVGVAILLSSLYNLYLMTYAGFFVNLSHIPPVLRWLRWFATLGYTLEALSVNEVGSGLMIVDTLAGVDVQIGAAIIMETLFGFGQKNYYRDVLVLMAFIVGYAGLLVAAVWFLMRERR